MNKKSQESNHIYTYPYDIDTTASPYMIISAYPYKFKLQKTGDNDNQKNLKKDYKFHFISYVPKDLEWSNGATYGNKKALGVTEIAGGDWKKAYQKGVAEALYGAIDIATTEFLGNTFREFNLGNPIATTKEQFQMATGIWEDPRLINVFQSPNFIKQSFNFKLLANSSDEANSIKLITTLFKYASLPSRPGDNNIGEIIPFLQSPMCFDIMVITPTEKDNTARYHLTYEYYFLNLTNVVIKPITTEGREDIPFYIDGHNIGYDLKLDFGSMHPVIKPSTMDTKDKFVQEALLILSGETNKELQESTVQRLKS